MSPWCRVGAGLVLLLTMLVSPMASVLCGLSCLELAATTHAASAPDAQRAAAAPPTSPCHEDSSSAPDPEVPLVVTAFQNAAWHQCDHPVALTSAGVPEIPRLSYPLPVASAVAHVSPPLFAPTPGRTLPARSPTAQHVSGFSFVLRI